MKKITIYFTFFFAAFSLSVEANRFGADIATRTGEKISVQKKTPELQSFCIDKLVKSLQTSKNDYASGGTWMLNGQAFGSFHQPMVFLNQKVQDLKIVLSQKTSKDNSGKATQITVVIGTVTVKKSHKMTESIQAFTREYSSAECENLDDNGILFSWVGATNEKLESVTASKVKKLSTPKVESPAQLSRGAVR